MAHQVRRSCDTSATTTSTTQQAKKKKNKNKKKKKRSVRVVRFNVKVMVKRTLHIKNYTQQEIEASWFTPIEYDNIKKRLFMILDFMQLITGDNSFIKNRNHRTTSSSTSSSFTPPPTSPSMASYCVRGLENVCLNYGMKHSTRIRRRNAVCAVFNEQDRQIKKAVQQPSQHQHDSKFFVYDDARIRDVYRNHTRTSEDIAISMGRIDAEILMSSTVASSLKTITNAAMAMAILEDNSDNKMTDPFSPSSSSSSFELETIVTTQYNSKDLFSTNKDKIWNFTTTCTAATTKDDVYQSSNKCTADLFSDATL
ncbi:hypothetical protein FRACYDRAFT_238327 [Fragilariopsis cylindrus CCMP1102]|uniref:Uncharacterized protein n=1 Tax=Fragilariopsis cylindrus CCMP1102 TaxID=635003 RepID=A0A1E7FID3_9STRA|nr:hypothetical protein FRACYDRAFT_238327 [Fragilariopsis cylindrus CCMP1102]|eukprot:OEU17897.1 hypothetical protein FRACYDRAFT_238327 [Fragilariopsis cylindrus CCMP1102]